MPVYMLHAMLAIMTSKVNDGVTRHVEDDSDMRQGEA